MSPNSLDVALIVSDSAAQLKFYSGLLGLPLLGTIGLQDAQLHLLGCGQSLLKLYERRDARSHAQASTGGSYVGISYITIQVDDLHRLLLDLKDHGIEPEAGPALFDAEVTLREPAGRVCAYYAMLRDPEGNTVELLQRVA